MLETIGVGSMNELLVDIPQSLRLESLQLPDGLSEFETMAQISALANRNTVFPDRFKVRKDGEPNKKTAAVIFQQPDFLGLLVDVRALTAAAHDAGALAIACVDPISLAILAPPGEYEADIAVGEGQQLGLSPSFGGPH